ncbi:MAG: YbaK/EbsC family protein [Candidatus Rokubacteria bacterium]|nr:YbaK/EbsC family protein [Candidatus Rokubacteria bacterium]
MLERLEQFLGAKQARFQLITDSGGVAPTASSLVSAWARVKVEIARDRDGLVMAVVPATCVVDFNRLARVIGHGPVRPASPREIDRAIPDCAPGAVPPFGGLFGLPTVVDHRLLRAREITMPAGDPRTLLRMRVTEYRRLAVPRVGDFAMPESLLGRRAIGETRASRRHAG